MFTLAAIVLDVSELIDGLLELAGQSCAIEGELGDEVESVDDIEFDTGFFVGRVRGAGEDISFEERDATEAPGGVGEFLDEVGFGGGGGIVFIEELAAVMVVGGAVFGREERAGGGQAVGCGVLGGTLFTGLGAGAGGLLGCAGINRHEVGNERVLQERRKRIHPDREFCAGRRKAAREA